MAIAERTAVTVWEGNLPEGAGTINGGSGALKDLAVTWAARTEAPGGKTSPEELAAAAHSSCYSMALSLGLGKAKTPPEKLTVTAEVTLDEVDGAPTIVSSELTVVGRVPGMDEAAFITAAEEAATFCPISRLFAGAQITIDASLEK